MQPLIPRELLYYTEGQLRSCESRYCDLWILSAKIDIPERELLESLLSRNEREHAGHFRFEEDRVRSIVAQGGLRRILSCYCCAPPDAIQFRTRIHGKPALLSPSSPLEFNVSHSGECVLIAVTSGVQCGVDIERGRPGTAELLIAEEVFCLREVEWLSRTEKGFLRLWATKEAIIKALGLGLFMPLSEIDVTDVLEGKTSFITLGASGIEPQKVWLNELSLVSGYAAAVATIQGKRSLRVVPDQIG